MYHYFSTLFSLYSSLRACELVANIVFLGGIGVANALSGRQVQQYNIKISQKTLLLISKSFRNTYWKNELSGCIVNEHGRLIHTKQAIY